MATPTPEQQAKIDLVRILVGDVEGSVFYPILTDDQYFAILEFCKWDVMKAARRIAISISLLLTQTSTRERTGDIEVWNSAATEYSKALKDFLDGSNNLPDGLNPYAAGVSKEDICKYKKDPNFNRSPLAQISPCVSWWTRWNREPCCDNDMGFLVRK